MRWLLPIAVVAGCSGPAAPPPSDAARADPRPKPPAPRAIAPGDAAPPPGPACSVLETTPPELVPTRIDAPVPPIVDSASGLGGFYEKLARVLRGRATDHVRIGMYGDSNLTRDYITGEIRRVLQGRYGDAGHGYVAFGKPWPWYTHMDIEHWLEPKAWRSHAVSTHAVVDQTYGFGGIAAQSLSTGARAWVKTAGEEAPVGRTASRADVFFLKHPRGRGLEILADGTSVATLDTRADGLTLGFHRVELEDRAHQLTFRCDIGVRLFGVALERSEKPSIVVDSLGVGGASVVHLARMRRPVARAALERRGYDLVLFLTGGTEDDNEAHDRALRHLIDLHREATPQVACLVMSPPDFAYGNIHAPKPSKRMARLGRRKRRIAEEAGCGFWDFRAAMGGELSIVKFAHLGLAWRDLVHLNEKGGALMGRRFLHALWRDFMAHVERRPALGCG